MAYQILLNKKRSVRTQQNATQKRSLGTRQYVTTFSQYFLFPAMEGPSLIYIYIYIYIFFFTSTAFSQQILSEKLYGFEIMH